MSSLSIVHVLSSFGMGGLERVALDLARGQRDLGHDVVTVSLAAEGEGPLAAEFRGVGLPIETVAVKPAGFDASVPMKLGKLFRRHNVDVVHTHNPQPLVMSALPARGLRAALIHTKHGVNPDTQRRLMMRRVAARFANRFVAVSEATAKTAREQRECPDSKLMVIPNGIDTERFSAERRGRRETRAQLGLADDDFFVLTVGRLWPEKGHEYLIRSLQPMLSKPGTVLAIAGDGPERENLEHFVADLDLDDRVRLLGNRRDVPELVAAADVFVLSSVREGLPLVIPEAMAGGLPVVSTSVGGIPKVVLEGETGFLVESGDREAMLGACRRLRTNPDLARKLGDAGRSRSLAEYSCKRMVSDYVKIYREARES